jgi:ParB-like chromosome segregation protein Spo0J
VSDYQVMPPLSDEERAALRADIAERGVLVPVVADQHGNILDGHHRKEIADELGVGYRTDVLTVDGDDEARSLARMYNLARRHLTREQKRQLIAEEITATPGRSDREIGRMMRCDHKTVGSVRRELAGEIPHHAGLTPAQQQMARMLFAAIRARALRAREVLLGAECADHERPHRDCGCHAAGMWVLSEPGECDDLDVYRDASQRFAEWALSSEDARGFLWDYADDDADRMASGTEAVAR